MVSWKVGNDVLAFLAFERDRWGLSWSQMAGWVRRERGVAITPSGIGKALRRFEAELPEWRKDFADCERKF